MKILLNKYVQYSLMAVAVVASYSVMVVGGNRIADSDRQARKQSVIDWRNDHCQAIEVQTSPRAPLYKGEPSTKTDVVLVLKCVVKVEGRL